MVHYEELNYETFFRYWLLVYPSLRQEFALALLEGTVFGVGAYSQEAPMGVIVFSRREGKALGRIAFFYVLPEYRSQGLGKKLMDKGMHRAQALGIEYFFIHYSLGQEWSLHLEGITQAWGFTTRACDRFIKIRLDETSSAVLLGSVEERLGTRSRLTTTPYRIIPYDQMTDRQRLAVAKGRDCWYPPILDPLHQPETLDPKRSQLLVKEEDVVGWLLICEKGQNALLYRSLFIREDCRNTGHFLRLILTAQDFSVQNRSIRRVVFNIHSMNHRFYSSVARLLKGFSYTENLIVNRQLFIGSR